MEQGIFIFNYTPIWHVILFLKAKSLYKEELILKNI